NVYLNSLAGTTAIVNTGTGIIKKSSGTSGTVFNVPLTAQSGSQFQVQSGLIYLGAVTSTGAAFTVSSGANLYFYYSDSRSFDTASTISGAGTLQVQGGTNNFAGTLSTSLTMLGGTLNVNSAGAQSIPKLLMQGGTLAGTANVNLVAPTATGTWTGG